MTLQDAKELLNLAKELGIKKIKLGELEAEFNENMLIQTIAVDPNLPDVTENATDESMLFYSSDS